MTKRFFTENSYGNNPSVFTDEVSSLFSNLKKDDLILLGIILILLGEGSKDKELILILGFLFISDKINLKDKLHGD